jgi:hypothetical protein
MRETLNKRLRNAGVRHGTNLLLKYLGAALLCAGAAAVIAVAVERVLGLELLRIWYAGALAGAAVVGAGVVWFVKRPRRLEVAVLVDDRLKLRERFSTAVALADSDDPFAQAAVADACDRAESVLVGRHFPVRPSRRWLYAAGSWAAAMTLFLAMPTLDLFSSAEQRTKEARRIARLERAKADVKQATSRVETVVKELGDAELSKELARLGDLKDAAKAGELRRDAIRKLGDLSEKLEKLKAGPRQTSARTLQEMLKGLRSVPKGLSRELDQALARGDLGKVKELLKDLTDKLQEGKLTEAQLAALAEQLKNIGDQLDKLAEGQKEMSDEAARQAMEDELARQGMDRKMASLNEKDLREALKKAGLTDEQIDKLMEQAKAAQDAARQACQQAGQSCQGLAQALGKLGQSMSAGQMTPGELAELSEMLDGLEGMLQEAGLTEASLGEIKDAIALLGAGQGDPQGLSLVMGGNGNGKLNLIGNGMGSGGVGGKRPTDESTGVGTTKTRAKTKTGEGPIVASWYFKGPQVKGESKKKLTRVLQAAKAGAAEAVSDNEIPRKYEESVKKYFGGLEESTKEE